MSGSLRESFKEGRRQREAATNKINTDWQTMARGKFPAIKVNQKDAGRFMAIKCEDGFNPEAHRTENIGAYHEARKRKLAATDSVNRAIIHLPQKFKSGEKF